MKNVRFLHELKKIGLLFFETREAAGITNTSIHAAGKHLESLRAASLVHKLRRGLWVMAEPAPDPLMVAEALVAPAESYISLHSALFFHGMIEQIPTRIYAVTSGRTSVVKTYSGTYSFHHCTPEFFFGYEYLKPLLKVATPEKALVDYLYFSPSKQRQFSKLPELSIPGKFSWKKANAHCDSIPSSRTRSFVRSKLSQIRAFQKK